MCVIKEFDSAKRIQCEQKKIEESAIKTIATLKERIANKKIKVCDCAKKADELTKREEDLMTKRESDLEALWKMFNEEKEDFESMKKQMGVEAASKPNQSESQKVDDQSANQPDDSKESSAETQKDTQMSPKTNENQLAAQAPINQGAEQVVRSCNGNRRKCE